MEGNNAPSVSAKQLVNMACAYADITYAELARRLGWSSQLLYSRLKTGKFSYDEWQLIAGAIGAKAEIAFVFPDGKKIE